MYDDDDWTDGLPSYVLLRIRTYRERGMMLITEPKPSRTRKDVILLEQRPFKQSVQTIRQREWIVTYAVRIALRATRHEKDYSDENVKKSRRFFKPSARAIQQEE